MKKLIQKLIAYSILSILLSSFSLSLETKAADLNTITKAIDKLEECITPKESNGYITTIIEEAFIDPSDANNNDNFKIKTCYRNTFRFMEKTSSTKGEEKTMTKLATECDKNGPTIEQNFKDISLRYYCEEVQVIFSKGGTTMLEGYIGLIYRYAATVVGVIAVLIIVLSGIQISVSGGDQEAVSHAKDRIIKSIAGIAVLFLSGIILYTINPTFFVQ